MNFEKETELALLDKEIESKRADELQEQIKEMTDLFIEARQSIKVLLYLIEDVLLEEIEDDILALFVQDKIDKLNLY